MHRRFRIGSGGRVSPDGGLGGRAATGRAKCGGSPPRISPAEAYQKVKDGTALLVCAYPDDETFRKMQMEGAISFKELEARLPGLKKDQEIIFYCS